MWILSMKRALILRQVVTGISIKWSGVLLPLSEGRSPMFHYLDNEKMPKSTNGLESFFGHLKGHLNVHIGLSKGHRKDFVRWYLFFKNR